MDASKTPFLEKEVVLSFFDTLIYGRDLELLHGEHWINDVLIGFYNEYLEKFVYGDQRADIALVHPDVVFACQSVDPISAEEITKDLKLPEKKFVFLPINNNTNTDAAGGTHWSLLVYHRPKNVFFHLDSWSGNNLPQAQALATLMEKALGITTEPQLSEIDVPQQRNGFDCGMYVICFSEIMCGQYLEELLSTESAAEHNVGIHERDLTIITPDFVAQKRKKLYDLILHLREIL